MERIWIYTLSKQLNETQLNELALLCQHFVANWTAHDVSLDATYELYKNRLLLFKVNETTYNASGCSIDKQLRFVKELETKFDVELLNRLLVVYENNNELEVVKAHEIKQLLQNNIITENTIVYDNTITTTADVITNWKKPLQQTWLNKYLITQ